MWITKLISLLLVTLVGLLPSSCSTAKKSATQKNAPVVTIVTSAETMTNRDLGELQLTNHFETCVSLGAGKSCTIKPNLLGRSNLQLTMALESKGANGTVKDLSVVQVVTKADVPFEVAVGDMNLTLTPKLSSE